MTITLKILPVVIFFGCGYTIWMSECLAVNAINVLDDEQTFVHNSKAILECTIDPYTGSQAWKVDSVIVADCGLVLCSVNTSNPARYSFSPNRSTGNFIFTIEPVLNEDNGNVIECFDGSNTVKYNLIVTGPVTVSPLCESVDKNKWIIVSVCGELLDWISSTQKMYIGFELYRFFKHTGWGKHVKYTWMNIFAWIPILGLLCKLIFCNVGTYNKKAKGLCIEKCKEESDIEGYCLTCNGSLCKKCFAGHCYSQLHRKKKFSKEVNEMKPLYVAPLVFVCFPAVSLIAIGIMCFLCRREIRKQSSIFISLAALGCALIISQPLVYLQAYLATCESDILQPWYIVLLALRYTLLGWIPVAVVLAFIKLLEDSFYCDYCKCNSRVHGYCIKCRQYLCYACTREHKKKERNHSVLNHSQKQDGDHSAPERTHCFRLCNGLNMEYYCFDCKTYIRSKCIENHRGHLYLQHCGKEALKTSCKTLKRCGEQKDTIQDHKDKTYNICEVCNDKVVICRDLLSKKAMCDFCYLKTSDTEGEDEEELKGGQGSSNKQHSCTLHKALQNIKDGVDLKSLEKKSKARVKCLLCKVDMCFVCFNDHLNVNRFLKQIQCHEEKMKTDDFKKLFFNQIGLDTKDSYFVCEECKRRANAFCYDCNRHICNTCNNNHLGHFKAEMKSFQGSLMLKQNLFCTKCREENQCPVECLNVNGDFMCASCFEKSISNNDELRLCKLCYVENEIKQHVKVYCLVCKEYMCVACFKWHRRLKHSWRLPCLYNEHGEIDDLDADSSARRIVPQSVVVRIIAGPIIVTEVLCYLIQKCMTVPPSKVHTDTEATSGQAPRENQQLSTSRQSMSEIKVEYGSGHKEHTSEDQSATF